VKVVIATPTIERPFPAYLDSLEASVPAMDAAGIDHSCVFNVGSPYISHARAVMLRKALDAKADVIVFIDHDMQWRPQDLVRLIEKTDPVVAGTYRFKIDEERYMGTIRHGDDKRPIVREDGCIAADWVPAGFLKVTAAAVDKFIEQYPQLCFGPRYAPYVDLFNHGAHERLWYGEDYAFSRNWNAKCGQIWLIPDLELTHHSKDKAYPGNYHEYLLRRPGGSKHQEEKSAA
jgi:hypothetical protein